MSKKCSVLNCTNKPESGIYFYKFPVDFDLCMQWVQNTGNPTLWNEFQYGGAYPFLSRFVCCDHFLDNDFVIFGDKNSGLTELAVPCNINIKSETLDSVELPIENMESLVERIPCKSEYNSDDIEVSTVQILDPLDTQSNSQFFSNMSAVSAPMEEHLLESDEPLLIPVAFTEVKQGEEYGISNRLAPRITWTAAEEEKKIKEKRSKKGHSETPEQREKRLAQARIRVAERRRNMTQEEKERWKLVNKIQTRKRRENEDEIKKVIRRYNDAIQVSVRRNKESEEEKAERRYKDALRTAEKRKNETPEEREKRLRRDRERMSLKRMDLRLNEPPEKREKRLLEDRQRKQQTRRQEPPTVISILLALDGYLQKNVLTKEQLIQKNVGYLMDFIKSRHPYWKTDYIKKAVNYALTNRTRFSSSLS